MTINTAIALTNVVLAFSLIALGVLFLWQAHQRHSLFQWPVSALVALGIVPLVTGTAFFQIAIFRIHPVVYPFGVNDPGTLALRILATLVVLFKLHRVYSGKLLTSRDRTRIVEESP